MNTRPALVSALRFDDRAPNPTASRRLHGIVTVSRERRGVDITHEAMVQRRRHETISPELSKDWECSSDRRGRVKACARR
jgi:hypothetical protein